MSTTQSEIKIPNDILNHFVNLAGQFTFVSWKIFFEGHYP
jgi:hypothetical protein